MASEVFYIDIRPLSEAQLIEKIPLLITRLYWNDRIKKGDLTAVKVHFGERGNTTYLPPNIAKKVVCILKDRGARPFLTDTNTLYVGSRSETMSHMRTAMDHGFDFRSIEVPVVIADGVKGSEGDWITIEGGVLPRVKIAREIIQADAIVGLSHFKAHELFGFGGALKNIGMGCATREGKLSMHSTVAPFVTDEECTACNICVSYCAFQAITVNEAAKIDPDACSGCGECIVVCPEEAIDIKWNVETAMIQKKLIEHNLGVLNGKEKKCTFINVLTKITPHCDCCDKSDPPIMHDIGILASNDPVALDQASVDMVNQLSGTDKFREIFPKIDWSIQLEYGEKIGLGSRKYRMIRVE